MDRTSFERLSIQTALALNLCVAVGLWIYTGYSFTSTITGVREEAAAVAVRYSQAQQLLATIRTQLLLSSVRVRDALLTSDANALAASREEVEESYHVIMMAIEDYEPIVRSATESDHIVRLRVELDRFHQASGSVLGGGAGRSPVEIRDVLNRDLMPPREAALLIADEVQTLNRQAYIGQQSDVADIYRAAERDSRWQLGTALALSLAVLLLTSAYAAKLNLRLHMQLKRDIRLAKELHASAEQLADERSRVRRVVERELYGEAGELLNAMIFALGSARRAAESGGDATAPIIESEALASRAMQRIRDRADD